MKTVAKTKVTTKTREMTDEGRAAISAAQTKRWNKFRREQKAAAKAKSAKSGK